MNKFQNIMILDDDPLQIKILTRQLNNLGYVRVIGLNSAIEALAILEDSDTTIDMMFLDLKMPNTDGLEVLRQLSNIHYAGALVLFSGADQSVMETSMSLAKAHQLSLLGGLSKPCGRSELCAIIELWKQLSAPQHAKASKTYSVNDIQHAIEKGEFVNFYQPKVRFSNGSLADVETLVRWNHPEDGLIYPDQFISLAEESGLICSLTHGVLAEALAQVKCWRQAGLECGVAVNVSVLDLNALDFPEYVMSELERNDLRPSDLTLEITESRLITDYRASMEVLARLRLHGIKLSIDDFGTGHSSLVQLRDLPFTELKFDRGFVDGVHNDPTLSAIVEASGDMAHHLEMKVVAEGIEDLADWHWLRSRGYDLAQGYLIAKPMLGEKLASWLVNWNFSKQELIREFENGHNT